MKRILSVMLSMLLCLSCVSVGMTAVFAEDAEYTPVVSLTPEMYSPKTVYTDDDFNNRDTSGTDLSVVAEGQTAYQYPVIMQANSKPITNYSLGYDTAGGTYAKASANWKSMTFLTENNVNVDRIAGSFKFKFPTYTKGMYFCIAAAPNGGTSNTNLFQFQYTAESTLLISYYSYSDDTATSTSKKTVKTITENYDSWNRMSFEFTRTLKEGSTSEYNVYISKLYFTNEAGVITDLTSAASQRINVDWWSGSVKESNITDASKVTLRIGSNSNAADLSIDDVMMYEPDDLRLKSASYDSENQAVKAVFTRGLDATTLTGRFYVKDGDNKLEISSAELDPSDTSNRTVILTMAAPLDVEKKGYTVEPKGVAGRVADLDGNAVSEEGVSFGNTAAIVTTKFYLNDTEVTGASVGAAAGDVVKAEVKGTNTTENSVDIMPILAYFEDGILRSENVGTVVTVAAGQEGTISASITMPSKVTPGGEFVFYAFAKDNFAPIMPSAHKTNEELPAATLYLVGDSICAKYPNENQYPQTGWGDPLTELLSDKMTVVNCAHGGFSTKSFMDSETYSGNWGTDTWNIETVINSSGETKTATPILPRINEGDYVIVSLGINDNATTTSVHTDEAAYKGYLKQMADDTKAKGAEMVFITPTISVSGKLSDADEFTYPLTNTYAERGQWMKETAAECGVACLDLGTEMYNYYKEISNNGTENFDAIRTYHLYKNILLKSVEEGGFGLTQEQLDNHANSRLNKDHTGDGNDGGHLSTKGADMVAGLIVKLLKQTDSPLKYYIED